VTKLKQQEGRNLLVFGHTLPGESLLKHRLLDVLDISIHPLIVSTAKQFFRPNQSAQLKLLATKTFSNIVKLSVLLQTARRQMFDNPLVNEGPGEQAA